ncbi:MAG: alpha/beta fold hydrolase [Candidatus Dormiibacterota bacterium]
MRSFLSRDGLEIAYDEWAATAPGPPVVLHHGFGVDANLGWVVTGVVDALTNAGRHVVAINVRGSGGSAKPHDPPSYGEYTLAGDISSLFDALGGDEFDLVGFSHGAIVSMIAATQEPRVRRLVVGGVGAGAVELGAEESRVIPRYMVDALIPDDPAELTSPAEIGFRALADLAQSDRLALTALARSRHHRPIPLHRITAPTLVIAGERDRLARGVDVLRAAIRGATVQMLDTDHISATTTPEFTSATIDFLTG